LLSERRSCLNKHVRWTSSALRLLALAWVGALAGCAEPLAWYAKPDPGLLPPVVTPVTKINRSLRELPPPDQRVAVAVYGYADQTGQFKPAETVQSLSRAVTQPRFSSRPCRMPATVAGSP
jgi:curli production assembly/transport component CsgG